MHRRAIRALWAGLSVGAVAMAAALWVLSGFVSPLPLDSRAAALLGLCLLAMARDLGVVKVTLPERMIQVPTSVFDPGLVRGAFRFGIELGVGFRTRLTTTLPYVLALALLLGLPGVLDAGLVAFGFAAGRVVGPVHRQRSGEGERWDAAIESAGRRLAVSSSLVGAWALAWAGGLAVLTVGGG